LGDIQALISPCLQTPHNSHRFMCYWNQSTDEWKWCVCKVSA